MINFFTAYATEIVLGFMSMLAVIVSLFKAEAQETEAAAAAITELVDASHNLRQRLTQLEAAIHIKDNEIAELRVQAAQIPILQAQVTYLTGELSKMQMQHADERDTLLSRLAQKDHEIERLRGLLVAAGLTA